MDDEKIEGLIGQAFEHLLQKAGREYRKTVIDLDDTLQPAAWSVFRLVVRMGAVQPRTIASELNMDRGSVSHHLRSLKARDLVQSTRDGEDARVVWIEPTEHGRNQSDLAAQQWMRSLVARIGSWSHEDAGTFAILLDRFARDDDPGTAD